MVFMSRVWTPVSDRRQQHCLNSITSQGRGGWIRDQSTIDDLKAAAPSLQHRSFELALGRALLGGSFPTLAHLPQLQASSDYVLRIAMTGHDTVGVLGDCGSTALTSPTLLLDRYLSRIFPESPFAAPMASPRTTPASTAGMQPRRW
jgi:hypothetical protein